MKRREFVVALGGTVVAPHYSRAQSGQVPILGFLSGASRDSYGSYVAAFQSGLQELGYIDGQNLLIEFRWAEGQYDRLPRLLADLTRLGPAVIVATTGPGSTLAARSVTEKVPVVFVSGTDPVKGGLVSSLNRPEGNVTGVTFFAEALTAKRLELLRQVAPRARIALLVNPRNSNATPQIEEVRAASQGFGQDVRVMPAVSSDDLNAAFATLGRERIGAVLVAGDAFFNDQRDRLVTLAAHYSLPASYEWREYVAAGGLMSYGPDLADAYRQGGIYAGRLLNGAKPSDLPVLRPSKFDFVLNLKTARALGLTIPPTLLARADEVIE